MNFLAHLFLSCNDEELLIGNFIADYIRNREVANYSTGIQAGIRLHRKIDSFTDNHLIVRQGTKRLQPYHHKYSAVVIDVLYDYLLIHNWTEYSGQSFEDFTGRVYRILAKNRGLMPAGLRKHLPNMIAKDWLSSYGRLEGLAFTFERIKTRVSRPEQLDGAVESLQRDFDYLNEEFKQFFPTVIAMVEAECAC